MDDMFADIAADYDKMFPRDFQEDGRMLARLFKGHEIRTVLDCACGTGAHAAMLSREGYEVTGSDFSEAMLALAAQRRDLEGFEATFVRAAWGDLPRVIDSRFDAVICIGNSLPLAGGDSEVESALAGMYRMVADGGVLIIQNRNMDRMLLERPSAILNDAGESGAYTLFIFEYSGEMVTYKIFYLETGPEHAANYGEFPMNMLSRSKLEKMLGNIGVSSWSVYGDSRLSRFSPSRSPRLLLVAER